MRANAVVWYRYGSEKVGWSSVASFLVPPSSGPDEPPLKFLAMVDVGTVNPVVFESSLSPSVNLLSYTHYGSNSTKLLPFLLKETAHMTLIPGDLAYANGVSTCNECL